MIATASPAALQHDGALALLIAWILGATLRLEAGAQGLDAGMTETPATPS